MSDTSHFWTSLGRFLFETGSSRTVARVRIALCLSMLIAQLAIVPDVLLFYSGDGLVSNDVLRNHQADSFWSLLHFIDSPWGVRLLHIALLTSLVTVLIGAWTTPAAVILFVLNVSFRHRNPLITNAGDQLITIFLFWLMFADSGRVLSVDAWRKKLQSIPWSRTWVLRMMQMQVCFVYGCSFLQKLTDADWMDGTTMFYVASNVKLWNLPMLTIMDHPIIYKGITYGTLLFEAAYPLFIWWKKTRYLMITLAILLHTGIGLLLGIPFFSLYMIALQLLFWETDGGRD